MIGEHGGYLDGLPLDIAARLAHVNRAGLNVLYHYVASGEAVAFLGAGVSAPLYPLWPALVAELIDAAEERGLRRRVAQTCRQEAASRPDGVVEIIREDLGSATYQALLRDVFRVRRDPHTGRTWTLAHELVCRSGFKAVVTTNYDPGILDARMRVRPRAVGTGFTTWTDETGLDRWRTGDVFDGQDELPVLFAHGHHNQPEAMVLATSEYRKAYAGKLASVIARMFDAWHLVWLGFSFKDARIEAILREVAERSGPRAAPSAAPRHVAVMAWDPRDDRDPATLARLAARQYAVDLVLYPAPDGDHSALSLLLTSLTVPTYPDVPIPTHTAWSIPVAAPSRTTEPSMVWVHGVELPRLFVGRTDELSRLNRWAADPSVRLIAVTAWGGAGKTALATHWLKGKADTVRRADVQGLFAWSFYTDPRPDAWAKALLAWAAKTLGVTLEGSSDAARVINLLRTNPVVLLVDGLETVQEGPASDKYGRLLDGLLREVLIGACRNRHRSLVVLTSRFPFSDLSRFDGSSARMLELPGFTPAEGAALLAAFGVGLPDAQQRELVAQVEGHALAVSAMAVLLAQDPDPAVAADLLDHLDKAGRVGAKVGRVLAFYAERLSEAHRYLAAAVSLFSRPTTITQVLRVADHTFFAGRLNDFDSFRVRAAIRGPLAGLLTLHADEAVSAHPLVRQTFRPLALGAADIAVQQSLTGTPRGPLTDRDQATPVVEAIELFLEADQWRAADGLYRTRAKNGHVWRHLPAARLGQRAATAFVATSARQQSCATQLTSQRLGHYLNSVGLFAMIVGDLATAQEYLDAAIDHHRDARDGKNLSRVLLNQSACLAHLGEARAAGLAAKEALTYALEYDDQTNNVGFSHVRLAWAAHLSGDTPTAEQHFQAADCIELSRDANGRHLSSVWGVEWAWFLCRTYRLEAAHQLTVINLNVSQRHGWNEDVARCRVLLAQLNLAANDLGGAGIQILEAITILRNGDYLLDLTHALTISAEQARQARDLDAADRDVDEAVNIATPRGLVPSLAQAFAVRARIAADRHTATGDPNHIVLGRDAADAALRLATTVNPLPWAELEALRAHAYLDRTQRADHGWSNRFDRLHHELVPDWLEPNPLATAEAAVKRISADGAPSAPPLRPGQAPAIADQPAVKGD